MIWTNRKVHAKQSLYNEQHPSKESSQALIAKYFATSQPQLRAFIRALIFNPSDVDDILQDVAVVAIEKAERFDPQRGDAGAWVMGIARNRVLKYLDKSKRQKLRFSAELVEVIADAAIRGPDSSDTLDALKDCLGTPGTQQTGTSCTPPCAGNDGHKTG